MNFTFDEMIEIGQVTVGPCPMTKTEKEFEDAGHIIIRSGLPDRSIICGDCLVEMPKMNENSVDSIVTDPPYGLSFMGKDWDLGIPGTAFWKEALRVAKPGAHLLAFGGTRTHHRLAVAIEDAGWEIRDTVMWAYGSGFPKSLDISKAIDKSNGFHRGQAGAPTRSGESFGQEYERSPKGDPITAAAAAWAGWGTGLKPAWEPIILARKPIEKGLTIAENVIKWGTGGLNIDGCRVVLPKGDKTNRKLFNHSSSTDLAVNHCKVIGSITDDWKKGRFPANLIHDGSEEVTRLFPNSKSTPYSDTKSNNNPYHSGKSKRSLSNYNEEGSAARFFYCAKASKSDRDEGLGQKNGQLEPGKQTNSFPSKNGHPTVKPTKLMAYLCRLVTPPEGLILDPFAGSGSTGKACKQEGFRFVGIEINEEYCQIARARTEVGQADSHDRGTGQAGQT